MDKSKIITSLTRYIYYCSCFITAFIKKGQNSATIEIKIKNNSAKAFKPNVYGDFITIVRTLNASGGSSYKVKSATGN